MLAVVDAGPLYAAIDLADQDHERCVSAIARPDLDLIFPALIVAEVTYLVGRRLGSDVEARFLAGLSEVRVEAPSPEDWPRIAALVRQYRNFPLGGADASVIALAERLDTDIIITLDERHFRSVRPRHRTAFRLLPADA